MSNNPSLAEVTEADAPRETRAIYDDIRDHAGMVNLIFRHLATVPGALPWAWGRLRAVYRSGAIAGLAHELRGTLNLGAPARLTLEAFSLVGIDAAARDAIARMLEAYNAANAMNLIAMTGLRRTAHDGARDAARTPFAPSAAPMKSQPVKLPPLPELSQLPPAVAALALMLNQFGEAGPPRAMASLYRHLAHWPAYLALCAAYLTPLQHNGALDRVKVATIALADRLASRLDADMQGDDAMPAGVAPVLDIFATAMIAKMVPIGHILAAALPAQPSGESGA